MFEIYLANCAKVAEQKGTVKIYRQKKFTDVDASTNTGSRSRLSCDAQIVIFDVPHIFAFADVEIAHQANSHVSQSRANVGHITSDYRNKFRNLKCH